MSRKIEINSTLVCCIGTIGKCGYTDKTAATNQQITAISFKESSKYYYYLIKSARNELEILATGNVLKILNSERLGTLLIPKLPAAEASTIAAFLDYETARIDRLIEKQQRLIALLKEKRQAVISHAVTKGLNPDAPMKDSGVEWLGEVPAHWEVTRLKYRIRSMDQGWSPQCETRVADEDEFGVLKVGAVNGGIFKPEEHKALPPNLKARTEYRLKKNQLLISRANTRELVGSSAVVPKDFQNLLLCDKLYRLTNTY